MHKTHVHSAWIYHWRHLWRREYTSILGGSQSLCEQVHEWSWSLRTFSEYLILPRRWLQEKSYIIKLNNFETYIIPTWMKSHSMQPSWTLKFTVTSPSWTLKFTVTSPVRLHSLHPCLHPWTNHYDNCSQKGVCSAEGTARKMSLHCTHSPCYYEWIILSNSYCWIPHSKIPGWFQILKYLKLLFQRENALASFWVQRALVTQPKPSSKRNFLPGLISNLIATIVFITLKVQRTERITNHLPQFLNASNMFGVKSTYLEPI
jgi:hypothetical protein